MPRPSWMSSLLSAYSPNALQSGIALARGGFNPNRTMGVDPATGRLTFIASPGSPEADEDPFTQGSVAFYPKPLDQMDPSQVIHEGEHVGQNEWTGGLSEIFSKALGAMLPSGHQTNPAEAAAYGATAAAGFPYDQSAAETFRSTTNPVEKLITSVLGGDIPPAPVRPPALVPGSPEWQARFGASSSPADQTPPAWQGPPLPAAAWQGPPVPPDVLPTTDYEFNEALPDVLPTDPRFGSNPNNPANSLLASPVAGPQPTTHITAPARRTSGTGTNNNGGFDAAAARDNYFNGIVAGILGDSGMGPESKTGGSHSMGGARDRWRFTGFAAKPEHVAARQASRTAQGLPVRGGMLRKAAAAQPAPPPPAAPINPRYRPRVFPAPASPRPLPRSPMTPTQPYSPEMDTQPGRLTTPGRIAAPAVYTPNFATHASPFDRGFDKFRRSRP